MRELVIAGGVLLTVFLLSVFAVHIFTRAYNAYQRGILMIAAQFPLLAMAAAIASRAPFGAECKDLTDIYFHVWSDIAMLWIGIGTVLLIIGLCKGENASASLYDGSTSKSEDANGGKK